MHYIIVDHLIKDYNEANEKGLLSAAKIQMIRGRIVSLCGTQLSIILAQKPSKHTLAELKEFERWLSAANQDIYERFLQFRTMKMLKATGYLSFYPLSWMHRKRENAD